MRGPAILRVGPDRLQLFAGPYASPTPPEIPGYSLVRDSFVRRQTSRMTYARVRINVNRYSGTRLFLQYWPQLPGLSPFEMTVVGNDSRSLSLQELLRSFEAFEKYRLLLLELAFDFLPRSGIGLQNCPNVTEFSGSPIQPKHGCFPTVPLYGGRKADKYVRCYLKEAVGAFELNWNFILRGCGGMKF